MICPNCKTELVEVNGRFICSDCGREIPENEVMAGDWGSGGLARAGLYGAGTDEATSPEEGSLPITNYDTSLTESENEISNPNSPEVPIDTQSGPAIVEGQSLVSAVLPEKVEEEKKDMGFYTSPEQVPSSIAEVPVADLSPSISEVSQPPIEDILKVDTPVEAASDSAISSSEPITVEVDQFKAAPPKEEPAVSETPAEVLQPVEEPEKKTEVVEDMFAKSEMHTSTNMQDPGIYTDPMYENTKAPESINVSVQSPNVAASAPNRANLIVAIVGSVLVLLLLAGGVWGYFALTAEPVVPSPAPVVVDTTEEVVWQELQVIDGGFKVNMPGQPERAENNIVVAGAERAFSDYSVTTDGVTYTAAYMTLDAPKAQEILSDPATNLPLLVGELAEEYSFTSGETKVGKYYNANSIDFESSGEGAAFVGKIILKDEILIFIFASSEENEITEYDKLIRSFNFITKP